MLRTSKAWNAALRPKRCLLAVNSELRDVVASKLMRWTGHPSRLPGVGLKTQYPHDEGMRVSHETIYRSLFIQARGALKKELDGLPAVEARRMRQYARAIRANMDTSRGQIVDAVSIRERPAEAKDRAIPGHWEGDLLAGGKNSYIADISGAAFPFPHAG